MAKVIMPLMSGQASGQFANTMVFQKNGVVREYVIPANPNSTDQQTYRGYFGDVQRELKDLGVVLRASLPSDLGSHWNSMIIGEITDNLAAFWLARVAEYNAFQAGEKTTWETADHALGLVNSEGLVLYIVAYAVHEITERVLGTASIALPEHDNGAAIGTAWRAAA